MFIATEFESGTSIQFEHFTESTLGHGFKYKLLRVLSRIRLVSEMVGWSQYHMDVNATFSRVAIVLELETMVMLRIDMVWIIRRCDLEWTKS